MTLHAIEPWAIPGPGDTIAGKYLVEGERGRGGFAVVLTATHRGLNRRVAIKLLLPEWSGHPDALARFRREGYGPAQMRSEHAVRVFDVDTLDNGAPYFVFEYLDGDDLEHLLQVRGPLPVRVAVDWTLQAAEALAEAHACGVVHRDVKPSNLVLTTGVNGGSCIKVIDFGLAKIAGMSSNASTLTSSTQMMGSPDYMAPEQLRAKSADHRVDIWALGAVLHQLLAGEAPFRAPSLAELFVAILTLKPTPLSSLRADVPRGLEDVVLRCLEKDPDSRVQSMGDLAAAIAPFGSSAGRAAPVAAVAPIARTAPPTRLAPRELRARTRARATHAPPDSDSAARIEPFRTPASAGVVVPSLLVLAALGAALLFGANRFVHRHDAERLELLRQHSDVPTQDGGP